jgi:ribosomal protein S27AE
MTAYKQNMYAWVVFIGLGFIFILAALYFSNWFLAPLLFFVFGGHLVFDKIICPKCSTPVNDKGDGAFARFRPPAAFLRKKCVRCGWDLDKDYEIPDS